MTWKNADSYRDLQQLVLNGTSQARRTFRLKKSARWGPGSLQRCH